VKNSEDVSGLLDGIRKEDRVQEDEGLGGGPAVDLRGVSDPGVAEEDKAVRRGPGDEELQGALVGDGCEVAGTLPGL